MNAAVADDRSTGGLARTLLVVEDDVLTRYAICDAFRYAGYTVLEASSLADAEKIVRAIQLDLVFVDLHLPDARAGLSVARLAKEQHPNVKLIFTSGRSPTAEVRELEALGPFVGKPYLIAKVLKLVRKTLADAD